MNGRFPPIDAEFERLSKLYLQDKTAFHAERMARLALEKAKQRQSRSDDDSLLLNLEKIMAPLNEIERVEISFRSMTLSFIQLNELLQGFALATREN